MIVRQHVLHNQVLDVASVNSTENLLLSGSECKPNVRIGIAFDETLNLHQQNVKAMETEDQSEPSSLSLLEMYSQEDYMLTWSKQSRCACVTLKTTADNASVLRALWQAAWLERHSTPDVASSEEVQTSKHGELLEQSLAAMRSEFLILEPELERCGWQLAVSHLVPDNCSKLLIR